MAQAEPFETVDYEGREGAKWSIAYVRTLEPVAKEYGSNLVGLYDARRTLQRLIAE